MEIKCTNRIELLLLYLKHLTLIGMIEIRLNLYIALGKYFRDTNLVIIELQYVIKILYIVINV